MSAPPLSAWLSEPTPYPLRRPETDEEWAIWDLYLVQARQALQRAGVRELIPRED